MSQPELQELIRQSNALTSSRYDFSPTEKKVLYRIIQKVRHDYVEGTMIHDLWDNMYVYIDSSDLSQIADENHTERARAALRSLRHKDVEIKDSEGNWLNVGFINYSKYKAKTKQYEVEVSKEIMPHLVELAKNFTEYSLTVAISLKSKYSQRFYEWAHQYLGRGRNIKTFFMNIEDLRNMLQLGKGYAQKRDVKRKVLDVAMKELKAVYDENRCDLWLEYFERGRGNKTRFFFKIHTRNDEQFFFYDETVTKEQLQYILSANQRLFRKDPKFCKRIIDALHFSPEKIEPAYKKLSKIQMSTSRSSDLAPLWRYILREDFDIK